MYYFYVHLLIVLCSREMRLDHSLITFHSLLLYVAQFEQKAFLGLWPKLLLLTSFTNWLEKLTLSLPECLIEFCEMTLTFESADEILWCDHSNESSLPVLRFYLFFKISQNEIWTFGWNLLLAKFGSERVKSNRCKTKKERLEKYIYISKIEKIGKSDYHSSAALSWNRNLIILKHNFLGFFLVDQPL